MPYSKPKDHKAQSHAASRVSAPCLGQGLECQGGCVGSAESGPGQAFTLPISSATCECGHSEETRSMIYGSQVLVDIKQRRPCGEGHVYQRCYVI